MKHIPILFAIIALALLSLLLANAQTRTVATKHFERDGLAFDYPEGWRLTDSTSLGIQTVTLERKGSVAQIVVTVQDSLTPTCDFQGERKKIADALTKRLATEIYAGVAHKIMLVAAQISGSEVEGAQLQGVVKRKPVTGAVFSFRLNRRFVSLMYILAANDEPAQSAWNTVRSTLTIEPRVITVMGTTDPNNAERTVTSSKTSNHPLVSLPKPDYPKIAKSAHAAGTVKVQVTIDETGKVISARAIEGHPLLRATSVAAATKATFSQTKLCGEPVRVTGVIIYNFVAQ